MSEEFCLTPNGGRRRSSAALLVTVEGPPGEIVLICRDASGRRFCRVPVEWPFYDRIRSACSSAHISIGELLRRAIMHQIKESKISLNPHNMAEGREA